MGRRQNFRYQPKRKGGRKRGGVTTKKMAVLSDGQTELAYLDEFVKHHGLGGSVQIIPQPGVDAKTLLEYAREIKNGGYPRTRARSNFTEKYNRVYVVCDVETPHESATSRKIPEARDIARGNDIQLILSNPCVEVWFLLHWGGVGPLIDGTEAKSRMKGHVVGYGNNRVGYDALLANETDAITRAEQLFSTHNRDPMANPTTQMHLLIRELHSFKKA